MEFVIHFVCFGLMRLILQGHIWIVGSYFHFAEGFSAATVTDISTPGMDPMYVIEATKLTANEEL